MKTLTLLSLLLSIFINLTANASDTVFCMESGQKSAFIQADYTKNQVTLKYLNLDGSIQSEEALTGVEPDLSITSAVDENGEKLVIIQSITDDELSGTQIKVLLCTKQFHITK